MQSSSITPLDGLDEEIAAGKTLLELLAREQECLVRVDVDALAGVTEAKTQTVNRMTELAQRRHRALAAAGFDASEAGMQEWVKQRSAANEAWNALLTLAREAKELNRTNGLLIAQHMSRNQAALNILHGSQQGGGLYGPNGQATSQTGSRRLVVG